MLGVQLARLPWNLLVGDDLLQFIAHILAFFLDIAYLDVWHGVPEPIDCQTLRLGHTNLLKLACLFVQLFELCLRHGDVRPALLGLALAHLAATALATLPTSITEARLSRLLIHREMRLSHLRWLEVVLSV